MKLFKYNLILLLLLLLPIINNAQVVSSKEVTYKVGPPHPHVNSYHYHYFIEDRNLLVVSVLFKKIVIEKFDSKSFKLISTSEYDDIKDHWTSDWEIVRTKDKLFFFYLTSTKAVDDVYYREIDFKTGEFIGDGNLLVKGKRKLTDENPKYLVSQSSDTSKVLIQTKYNELKNSDGKNYDESNISVYDQNLDLIWQKETTMPYPEKDLDFIEFSVNNKGRLYALANYDEETKLRTWPTNIATMNSADQKPILTPINLSDDPLYFRFLSEAPNDELLMAGFQSDSEESMRTLIVKIDKNMSFGTPILSDFPPDVINQYKPINDRLAKLDQEKITEPYYLFTKKVGFWEDGSMLLISTQDLSFFTSSSTIYHYNDILVSKFDAEDNLVWMKRLPKRQNRNFGFKYFFTNGNHYFFYNDHIENMDKAMDERPVYYGGSKGILTAYKVNDKTGESSKISIINSGDVPSVAGNEINRLSPGRMIKLSESEFAIEGKIKKENVFVKFTIN